MSIAWYDLVGTVGVGIILIAYFLLQVERIDVQGITYSSVNLIGAALITVSLVYEFNFSAFLIEICWMAISVFGIARYIRQRHATKPARGTKS